ncbi:hypothetical protein QCE47_26920 [Caballeronia sp. LZ025]|nr:hypothetical protein [Caballeronia grimmiae]MDR5735954.1 hypothetical protein [Caballeronia sp. LZ025]
MNMPNMDGFQLALRLRRSSATNDIVLIAFTAFDELAVRGNAAAPNFDGYCQKAGAPMLLFLLIEQRLG